MLNVASYAFFLVELLNKDNCVTLSSPVQPFEFASMTITFTDLSAPPSHPKKKKRERNKGKAKTRKEYKACIALHCIVLYCIVGYAILFSFAFATGNWSLLTIGTYDNLYLLLF